MEGGKHFQDLDADKEFNYTDEENKLLHKWRDISHIDNFINIINNILHKNPKQKIYISTDLKSNYDKLFNIYGKDKIFYNHRDSFDRSLNQQKNAMIDIINLSRCKQFYGSYWSSFSELVTYFQKEEIKKSNVFSIDFKKYNNNNISNFISICYACKNRHNNLIQSIKSIINNDKINDIVVVDWNTDEINLYELLKTEIPTNYFWKINYIKIIDSVPWILTCAFNISFFYAKNNNIIKSDCDYIFSNKFIEILSNYDTEEDFYSFDYKNASTDNQKHLNGFFYFNKNILKNSSFFSNNILFYGYDDCYLKECFEKAGFTYNRLRIDDNDLYHLKGSNQERVKNQNNNNCKFKYINFFGFNIKNIAQVSSIILYNKIMCELYHNVTTYYDVLNTFSVKKNLLKFCEIEINDNFIPVYNTNCNYTTNCQSICKFEIFNKMLEYNCWCDEGQFFFE